MKKPVHVNKIETSAYILSGEWNTAETWFQLLVIGRVFNFSKFELYDEETFQLTHKVKDKRKILYVRAYINKYPEILI